MTAQQPYSLEGMARRLGIGHTWVKSRIGSQYLPDDAGNYSADCWVYVQACYTTFMLIPELGDMVTLEAAADELMCSVIYLEGLISANRLPRPIWRRASTNRVVHAISRRTITRLKNILLPFAPENMATVGALMRDTGWSHGRIKVRLAHSALTAVKYRDAVTGQPYDHYVRGEAVAILGVKPRHTPRAGSYLTANAIEKIIGCPDGWARRILQKEPFRSQRRMMLDDFSSIRPHYPASVVHKLRILLPAFAPDDMASLESLYDATGWSKESIRRRLEAEKFKPVQYRSVESIRTARHYPRVRALEVLGIKPQSVPPAGRWQTAKAMARKLHRSDQWVVRRLRRPQFSVMGRVMTSVSGEHFTHYPVEVYVALELESKRNKRQEVAKRAAKLAA